MIYPDRKYRVFWRDIAEIKTYERMILDTAKEALAKEEYATAFEHLNVLILKYPRTPMLAETKQTFLMESAMGLFRKKQLPQALAVLEEIRKSEPNLKPQQVSNAISRIAAELIEVYFNNDQLRTAQQMVGRLKKDYGDQIPAVAQWEARFRELAEQYKQEAIGLLEQQKYNDARNAALKMLEVDPNMPNGQELLQQIEAAHPTLRVAVFESTNNPDPTSLTDWPSRRVGALVTRSLFEFQNTGPKVVSMNAFWAQQRLVTHKPM